MVVPVLALSLGQIAVYMRLLRSDLVATLQEDFILMAKSKGISNRRVLWRHALRPSSLTLLTVAGLNIGTLIGGALVVEYLLGIPGMGSLIGEAILARQYVAAPELGGAHRHRLRADELPDRLPLHRARSPDPGAPLVSTDIAHPMQRAPRPTARRPRSRRRRRAADGDGHQEEGARRRRPGSPPAG